LPIGQLGHKAHKLAARLRHVRSSDDLYRSLVSEWRDPAQLLQGESPELPSTAIDQPLPACLSRFCYRQKGSFHVSTSMGYAKLPPRKIPRWGVSVSA
jgi:hypothetical protein